MSNSLQKYLEAAEGAGKVLAHARLLVQLAGIYQEMTPPYLAHASRVANYKSRVLVIHADSGAVATKLRQMAPTLAYTPGITMSLPGPPPRSPSARGPARNWPR